MKNKCIFFLVLLTGNLFLLYSCRKESEQEAALPTVTITRSNNNTPVPGEKVTFNIVVTAAAFLREVKVGDDIIKTYDYKHMQTADNFTYDWTVPAAAVAGDTSILFAVSDKQAMPNVTISAPAKVTIVVPNIPPVTGCVNFDETAVITGAGKTGVTDFSSLTAERLQNFIVASATDKVQVGVDNPRGCGKVLLFDKAPNIGWGGWNGFQLLLSPFSATEFTSFAHKTGSKVLKVDVYRDNTKTGAGDVPPEGLVMYVTLGNLAKLNAGPKPLGRGQFFKGLITASNTWQTITFSIDDAGPALDNTLGSNESDMLEFVPGIDVEADGGRYYFDNLRIENR